MKRVRFRARFLRDLDRMRDLLGSRFEIDTLNHAVELLAEGRTPPATLKPHALGGNWTGFLEFHLDDDWLVIYQVRTDEVVFHRTGTHRDLFA